MAGGPGTCAETRFPKLESTERAATGAMVTQLNVMAQVESQQKVGLELDIRLAGRCARRTVNRPDRPVNSLGERLLSPGCAIRGPCVRAGAQGAAGRALRCSIRQAPSSDRSTVRGRFWELELPASNSMRCVRASWWARHCAVARKCWRASWPRPRASPRLPPAATAATRGRCATASARSSPRPAGPWRARSCAAAAPRCALPRCLR